MTGPPDLSTNIAAAVLPRGLKLRSDLGEPGWTFWELRTLNRHRVVGLLNDHRRFAEAHDLETEIRSTVSRNFRRAWWRGLAYGVVAELAAISWSPKDLEVLVDIYENPKGVLQWVVLVANDSRSAVGAHTWMETYLSPAYREVLQALAAAGYQVATAVRAKDGLLKFITAVAEMRGVGSFPEFRDHP